MRFEAHEERPPQERVPTSSFILKRILVNDIKGVPGWLLNEEMRGEFAEMLRQKQALESARRWSR